MTKSKAQEKIYNDTECIRCGKWFNGQLKECPNCGEENEVERNEFKI